MIRAKPASPQPRRTPQPQPTPTLSLTQARERTEGAATWGDGELFSLYVKEPKAAQLALTVFDEDLLKEDEALGAASVKLAEVLQFSGAESKRSWSGWVPLTWRPAETQDNTVMVGTVAGAFVAGPMGAAAGGFLGSLIKKPVTGQVRLELRYLPLSTSEPSPPHTAVEGTSAGGAPESIYDSATLRLANRVAPKGGSIGVDWYLL